MSRLLDRIVERRRASAGIRLGPPAPTPGPDSRAQPQGNGGPPAQPVPAAAGLRGRAQMRRRARYLRKLRELQLRDIGGFVLELHRLGEERPELVQAKLAGAAATERELRALEHALGERRALREVREPGIGGACAACGTVHGSGDRYCSWCGRAL
ncbi:MAG TPA: hypothetical protein VG321_01130 [Solirubrobacteraceae bacterium]|nr:hypothetical protein [Solirubrobacteraceae bacterium]